MLKHGISSILLNGACGLALLATPVAGQAPPPPATAPALVPAPAPAAGRFPDDAKMAHVTVVPLVPPLMATTIAGLPEKARVESLTWRQVYELALVRSRSGGTANLEALDPQALAEQARRHGVADFARFRKEFLAGRTEAGGAFQDPSEAYLKILRRLIAIEDARRQVARLENTLKLIRELIQGENAGLSQIEIDLVSEGLSRARRGLSGEIAGYRDGLDELRVTLGLSPHAPVVPNLELAGFLRVWDAVEAWQHRPDRNLAELPRILGRLPAPGDVDVGRRLILREIEQAPDRMELELHAAARLAIRGRPDADRARAAQETDVLLELKVRRRIRHLLELRADYEENSRDYELAIRLEDQAFERLLGSTAASLPLTRTSMLREMIDHFGHAREAQDRLAATWCAFRAGRLALYRDLGVLPYDGWEAFYADLSDARGPSEQPPAAPGRR